MGKMNDIIKVSEDLLKKYPLCNRCLGRFFGKLGYGWSNEERGKAIKRAILMNIHKRIRESDEHAIKELRDLIENIGPIGQDLYSLYFYDNPVFKKCAVCGGEIDSFIEELSSQISSRLKELEINTFLIGAKVDRKVCMMEERIKSEFKLKYGESIKNEIKREIGKKIQVVGGFRVDFSMPDVVVEVSFPSREIRYQIRSMRVFGRYKKTKRGLSITKSGANIIERLTKEFGADNVVLHTIKRDEKDIRAIGDGMLFIADIKGAKRRNIGKRIIRGDGTIIEIERIEKKGPDEIREKPLTRLYRCFIFCENEISKEAVEAINALRNRTVEQYFNKKHRISIIKEVKCRRINRNIAECLIFIPEKLYVKEFVSGTKTTPSISSMLENRCSCIEGDLLYLGG
ncbi:MAG: tRNA pseudouridine(54/55) synthase Pus10 [Caldisphaeraceae archaeon]|nr:tRNA pseudouridine(54/55) synthase Pus10 [Caldisphaeraceae archaeon]